MPKYRLLALDLDGTTLTDDERISNNTRKWIHRATEAGVTVMFATGRGFQTAGPIWEELALQSPMVFANGAEIWKGPGRLWERHFIRREDIRWLYELATEAGARFWGYSVESLTRGSEWSDEMFERDWLKFGIRHDDLSVIGKLRESVNARESLEVTRSAPVNMEISRKGVTKATGVRKICEYLGIGMEQVMAVGDSLNDLRLIEAVGLGVAVSNADEELIRNADAVTHSNEEDGVANAIQRFLFGLGSKASQVVIP